MQITLHKDIMVEIPLGGYEQRELTEWWSFSSCSGCGAIYTKLLLRNAYTRSPPTQMLIQPIDASALSYFTMQTCCTFRYQHDFPA
jgi:hypothetical protein